MSTVDSRQDALYLLENLSLKVQIKGKGKVKSQDIQPGSALNKNQVIHLELN